MPDYRFRKGLHIHIRGRGEYVIEQRLPNGELQIKNVATNECKPVDESYLVESLFTGILEVLSDGQSSLAESKATRLLVRDLSLLKGNLRDQTKRRYAYVCEIGIQRISRLTKDTLAPLIEKVSNEIGDASPPSWLALYRWYRQYQASGEDIRSLVPAYKRCGNRRRKFSGGDEEKAKKIVDIIEKVIAEKYLSRNRPTIASICDVVEAKIVSENRFRDPSDQLSFPHRSCIYDIVNKLDPYEVMKARYGERIASHKYKANQQGPRPTRPLERVEIDHTKLDLLVVDPVMRLPVGRPWMTIAIDKYSKVILGMYMSFDPPGYLSVMQCLTHAIRPKTYVKNLYPNINHNWDAYGIPELIVCDNGPEFYSIHFEDACLQLGISIDYAPVKRGQYKGTVERFFRTQNWQLLHDKPGTTFSNILDRADYDPKKNAVIPYDALEELTHKFIIDIYHQTVHRALNDYPARVWEAAIAEYPPALPPRHTDLDILLGCIEHRTISASGIQIHSLLYNDERLAHLRRTLRPGMKVKIKYDPTNLSMIHVVDEERGEYIPVPAADPSYTQGLTLWQHKIIRSYAARRNKDSTRTVELILAKEEIQRIVEREWLTTKATRTKQKLARIKNYGQPSHIEIQQADQGQGNLMLIPGGVGKRLVGSEIDNAWNAGGDLVIANDLDHVSAGKGYGGERALIDASQAEHISTERDISDLRGVPRDTRSLIGEEEKGTSTAHGRNSAEEDLDMTGWGADYELPK